MWRLIFIPILLVLACAPCPTCPDSVVLKSCDLCIDLPSSKQVMDFIYADDTDTIKPDPTNFVCVDYTHQVNERAWAKGIPCYTVIIVFYYDGGGNAITHECVAFPVRDCESGFIFIEPQNDHVLYDVEAGKIPYLCEKDYCRFMCDKPVLKVLINK